MTDEPLVELAPPLSEVAWSTAFGSQSLEVLLVHLSWIVKDDDVVSEALADWVAFLDRYEPEPFRAFGPAVR